jgi:hypothetical protein
MDVGFEVLTVETLKNSVFRDITQTADVSEEHFAFIFGVREQTIKGKALILGT